MNIEEVRAFCLSFPNASEGFPFDDVSLVFKVEGKMFLFMPLDAEEPVITMKCDPERVIDLRDRYNSILPAWHFNKKYWNMVYLDGDVPDELLRELIHHSYREVIAKLPKKIQAKYEEV